MDHNVFTRSVLSDLKAQGANEAQIFEMLGVKPINKPNNPPNNNVYNAANKNNNVANDNANVNVTNNVNKLQNIETKEEKENKEGLIGREILAAVQRGNKDSFISSDDLEVLKRDDYQFDFAKISNGVCSFLGRKNNFLFDSEYQFSSRAHLFPHVNDSSSLLMNNNNNDSPLVGGDEVVISSLVFNHSSVSFLRKSLSKIPPTKEESKITLGENGLASITNPSFCPLLYEWKRNEVLGEARDIAELIKHKYNGKGGYPSAAVAEEEGKYLYLSIHSSEAHRSLDFVEWPVDMSLNPRYFSLFSYDVNPNLADDFEFSSLYSSARRSKVRIDENSTHEIKITKNWLIVVTYNNPYKPLPSPPSPLTLYFIDRSSLPPRSDDHFSLDQIASPFHQPPSFSFEEKEVIAIKMEIKFEGQINDVAVAYEDGNGSNVCLSVTPAGSSFKRYERIERSDRLRTSPSSSSSSLSSFSMSRSFFSPHSPSSSSSSHRVDEQFIGLPCTDQTADSKPSFIRHLFVDPRNPPALHISRDLHFDKCLKGSLCQLNPRAESRDSFIYLSVGSWPELDIHRTIDPSSLLLPPPSRHFPSLFTAEKSFLFPAPSFIVSSIFVPSSADPFSFSDDGGYIVLAVVTTEEDRLVEEFQIFDTKDFEKGPAFVIRAKQFDNPFNFGISNYSGVWSNLKSFFHL